MREEIVELGGLRAVSVGDARRAELVCVLVHGFQMTPADLSPFAHSLGLPVWFLFPEGPLEAEPAGRAWWRIDPAARAAALARGPRDFAGQHPVDLPHARARLGAFLHALDAHLAPDAPDAPDAPEARRAARPLVIGGFSQGAMLTCDTLLRGARADALLLLSGSRIAFDEWEAPLAAGRAQGLPVLVSHGEADADLSFEAGVALRDALASAGAEVSWVPFGQGHEIPLVVWRKVRTFLKQRLGPGPR